MKIEMRKRLKLNMKKVIIKLLCICIINIAFIQCKVSTIIFDDSDFYFQEVIMEADTTFSVYTFNKTYKTYKNKLDTLDLYLDSNYLEIFFFSQLMPHAAENGIKTTFLLLNESNGYVINFQGYNIANITPCKKQDLLDIKKTIDNLDTYHISRNIIHDVGDLEFISVKQNKKVKYFIFAEGQGFYAKGKNDPQPLTNGIYLIEQIRLFQKH
jgi:hypothetical protein